MLRWASWIGASAGHAASTSWGSASLLAWPIGSAGQHGAPLGRDQYGNRKASTLKAAVSMNKHLELLSCPISDIRIGIIPNIKVVACVLAAAVADPLGAGAVGDGCELKKVSKEEQK